MNHQPLAGLSPSLRAELLAVLGADGFDDRSERLALFSEDIWSAGETAAFIASPSTLEQLSQLAALAAARGLALNPRGAGMSYTNGYTPDRKGVGIVDFQRLNRIIEINADDLYATVEAGCAWADLHGALSAKGLRTPFFGPLSGLVSTIGGGISQNNAFFGAGAYGPTAESVLSLTVVLGDGTIIRTGSAGTQGAGPFFRHYGPDLTGLFCGDAGALGFKAQATLRLIPAPTAEDHASFEFRERNACADAMADVMRANRAAEVFGFDPDLQRVRLKRASLAADIKTLGAVVRNQGSVLRGIREGARVALAGRGFVDETAYALHFTVEGYSAAGAREDCDHLKTLCRRRGGREIENSIPKIMRAAPFGPMNTIIGPEGERWAPVHGIVAPSKARAAWGDIEALFAARRDVFGAHGVSTGVLATGVGASGFLIEPVFFWPEALGAIHKASVERAYLARFEERAENPAATALVAAARRDIIAIFSRHGAAHFQIGRTYPYREHRAPEAYRLLEAIKAATDPAGVVNPGALGLGGTIA